MDIEKIKQDALKRMRKCFNDDTELGHFHADKVLCDVLDELGFQELTAMFDKLGKWYA